jgi:gamma-glutamylcyclotransferase (GGCT)/AIG2-like uncharacterized protein YtfP
MSGIRYFAYGSNLDAQQMALRCPSARGLFRACLRDHRLDFTYFSKRWSGGSADVVPHFGANVWGIVYELNLAEVPELDRFEGGYQRIFLSVNDDQERTHPVLSYQVPVKRSFRPTASYLGKIILWGERWSLPPEYLQGLRRIPVIPEPGT